MLFLRYILFIYLASLVIGTRSFWQYISSSLICLGRCTWCLWFIFTGFGPEGISVWFETTWAEELWFVWSCDNGDPLLWISHLFTHLRRIIISYNYRPLSKLTPFCSTCYYVIRTIRRVPLPYLLYLFLYRIYFITAFTCTFIFISYLYLYLPVLYI